MTYHLVLPHQRKIVSSKGLPLPTGGPRDAMALLAHELSAQVHQPPAPGVALSAADSLRAKVLPRGDWWALARQVQAKTGPQDTVFCSSEAGGFQLAAVCAEKARRPRLAVFVHNVDRPRTRFALKWWHMAERVDLFLACSTQQVAFLRTFLNLPAERVQLVWDHTDTRFFTPGLVSPDKRRPLIVSVGLEQRDYKTLAAATGDLDIDVRISGFSKDAAALAKTFPATLPANMDRRFYAWDELLQLYRDADAVVVSCRENRYAAGVQSLMEGMACGRPVIATATEGLKSYLNDEVVRQVPPGNAADLRQAILQTLAEPALAARQASQGRALALQRHDMARYVKDIADALRGLTRPPMALPDTPPGAMPLAPPPALATTAQTAVGKP
ncbi:MAG: glycosyltransferase family 4 protein [Pseudomonadota bacterium]